MKTVGSYAFFFVAFALMSACTPFPYRVWSEPRPLTAPAAELGNWEYVFREFRKVAAENGLADKLDDNARDSVEPLDEDTYVRIEEARGYILSHAACDKCRFWDQTLANVQALGRTIRVNRSQRQDLRAGYFFYTDMVEVRPEAVADHTTVQLAAVLVHELTHRSWHLASRERTWFTRDEALLLRLLCRDYAQRELLADEVLAYRNMVAWLISNIPRRSGRDGMAAWLEMNDPSIKPTGYSWLTYSILAEKPDGQLVALDGKTGEVFDGYAKDFGSYLLSGRGSAPLVCGPPVIIRGPLRGRYENPAVYAPEITVPFLCANGFCP